MQWLWDNVYLSKDERDRYLFLISVFAVCLLIKGFFVFFYEPPAKPVPHQLVETLDKVAMDYQRKKKDKYASKKGFVSTKSTKTKKTKSQNTGATTKTKKPAFVPIEFAFDPNKISRDSLKLLGLSRHAINSLMKYRSKGGKIKTAKQLQKVNGLEQSTYERLVPYVDIATPANKTSDNSNHTASKYAVSKYQRKNPQIIEINSADTSDFMNFYGIGSVYANRIVNFRNSLGGFFTIAQVGDTWGIKDSLYESLVPYLTIDTSLIKKQDINTATKDQLNKHPYINWQKSKHILKYKKMHGPYKTIDDLYKLHGIAEEFVDTMKIYYEVR